jgi:hypothetical protein
MSQSPNNPKDIRLYILANSELPPIHAGIQSLHSSCELVWYFRDNPLIKEWIENHKTVVLLSASITQMEDMKEYFRREGKIYKEFLEPDLDNLLTSIAFEPMTAEEGKTIFGRFELFR